MKWRGSGALVALAQPYPWIIPGLAVLGIAASLAEGLSIGLLIPVLNELIGAEASVGAVGPLAQLLGEIPGELSPAQRLPVLAAVIVGLIGVKTALFVGQTILSGWLSSRVGHDLRVAIGERVLGADYAHVMRLEQGHLVNLIQHQSYRAGQAMALLCVFLGAVCTVLVFGVLLALMSWRLSIVVVLVVLPVSLFVRMMMKRGNRLGEVAVRAWSKLAGCVVELVGSLRTIRLFHAERAETARLAEASDSVRRAELSSAVVTGIIQPVVEFFYVPIFIAVTAVALHMGIGLPFLLAYVALLYRLQAPLKRLDHVRVELAAHAATMDEVHKLLAETVTHPAATGTMPAEPLRDAIEFENVSFSYADSTAAALRSVTFRIRRGEVIALVGPSGAGKSTLVNLLFRLYEPTAGRILIDGRPLADFDTVSWRSRIAFAGQDSELMTGSVRHNVTYGAPSAPEPQIRRALRLAHAEPFVGALPDGLDADVGPRGRNLSGGQRQRIALARAFIREPDLLVLDEATNAVDNVTESEIQVAIDALAGRCTILIIAHRLGTLRRADRAIVLEAGRIVEQGPPADLLAARGALARQYALS